MRAAHTGLRRLGEQSVRRWLVGAHTQSVVLRGPAQLAEAMHDLRWTCGTEIPNQNCKP